MQSETREFISKTENREVLEDSGEPVPLSYIHVFHKEYPRFPSITLPQVKDPESQLEFLLNLRKSTRKFSDKPLALLDLGQILGTCRIIDIGRDPEWRTYPSGGARFPVELYVASYNTSELPNGAYHYNLKENTLEQLLEKDLAPERRGLVSPYLENPAAVILFTSVIARSEVKYGLRSYPYSLLEAGHMGQNIHLKCAELGIGSCSVSGFVDNLVKTTLDLTEDEIPIYSISVGWEKSYGR